MPIITKAGSPVKGSPTEFTLDKAALAAVTSVAADAYFSDDTNWKEVRLNYKSSTGKQKEIVKFDASLASPAGNFAVSLKARDVFEIHKIVIKDFDGGSFEVPRSALTTAEFDVDLAAGSALLTRTFSEASPGSFASESASFISSGNLVLPGTSSISAVPFYNKFAFDIPSILETPSQFNGLINYKIKLTISSSDLQSGGSIRFDGGYGAAVIKEITSTDLTNGYVEISGLYIKPGYANQLALGSTGAVESISLSVSKLEIFEA